MLHRLYVIVTMLVVLVAGCAADVGVAEPASSDPAPLATVRVYTLHGDSEPTVEELAIPRPAVSIHQGDIGKTAQALALYSCASPDYDHSVLVYHDANVGVFGPPTSMYVCIRGLGTLDLTNTYYANPFLCWYQPNPTACLANIRVSGNVRTVWNANNVGGMVAEFISANLDVYDFHAFQSGVHPYGTVQMFGNPNTPPPGLVNATLLYCW